MNSRTTSSRNEIELTIRLPHLKGDAVHPLNRDHGSGLERSSNSGRGDGAPDFVANLDLSRLVLRDPRDDQRPLVRSRHRRCSAPNAAENAGAPSAGPGRCRRRRARSPTSKPTVVLPVASPSTPPSTNADPISTRSNPAKPPRATSTRMSNAPSTISSQFQSIERASSCHADGGETAGPGDSGIGAVPASGNRARPALPGIPRTGGVLAATPSPDGGMNGRSWPFDTGPNGVPDDSTLRRSVRAAQTPRQGRHGRGVPRPRPRHRGGVCAQAPGGRQRRPVFRDARGSSSSSPGCDIPRWSRCYELGVAPDGTPLLHDGVRPRARRAIAALAAGDWPALYFVAAEVALGLEALHDLGIVHGDLKPSNLLVIPGTRRRACRPAFGCSTSASP